MLNENPFFSTGKKEIAFLIDPDTFSSRRIHRLRELVNDFSPSYFFVGGSFLTSGNSDAIVRLLKARFDLPVILFPGDHAQISPAADAILFLSLLSGRNPEYLIGQQVKAAPLIKKTGLTVIPTAYLLIDGGNITTVQYVTGTTPIPADKPDLIVATALAGQYMGMKAVYLEAGSGAKQFIAPETVEIVKKNVSLPLIIGGGIKHREQIKTFFEAGADVVVLGTLIEKMLE
jgi:putative glycerol-1-phosphate prenyltransferase